ncbi:hypothetical protein BGZ93_002078, partial [Podila epicladia]
MAYYQANGVTQSQGNNQYSSVQESNAALKNRLASIALKRQEKLKAEVCSVIEAFGSRSETEYLIDEYIQVLTQKRTLERENAKLKTSYTDITVIKESQFKHLQQLQQLVTLQQGQLLHYQKALQQPQAQQPQDHQQQQLLLQPPQEQQQQLPQQQQLQLQPLQQDQQNASSQISQVPSIAQLQGDLDMTVAELTRAMEDVETLKKRVEELESASQDLHTQLETKHNVNYELGQILETKIKEQSKLQAEQNRNRAEVHIAATLGSLKSYQLYAAVSVISEYYELLAPLVENKSKEALKDLAYLKDLNMGLQPTNIGPGMLPARMVLLRQQIYTESQTLQKAVAEASKASSESILVLDTPPQLDQTTPISGATVSISARRGPKPGSKKTKGPPKRIVAANQIAPGIQKNAKKNLTVLTPTVGPHDKAPTESPSTPTFPGTPSTESFSTSTPPVLPTEPAVAMPVTPKTSTAALLQMHKQRMQEQQALLASESPSISLQHLSPGTDAIVIPNAETASETATPTPEHDVNRPSESIKTGSKEEVNTSATTRSSSEQEPIDLDEAPAMHFEASDALSEKFRAMDVKRAEQAGVSDDVVASIGGGEPSIATNLSGDFTFTPANVTPMLFPDIIHATSSSTSSSMSPKARQSPGYDSADKKRQVQDLSPTLASFSDNLSTLSFFSASKRPKFPAFEMSVISQSKKTTKPSTARLSHVAPRPKKGRWFLEA